MSVIIYLTTIGFLLLLPRTTVVNPAASSAGAEHSGQHVTPTMANIKDNKTKEEQTEHMRISTLSPTWSSSSSSPLVPLSTIITRTTSDVHSPSTATIMHSTTFRSTSKSLVQNPRRQNQNQLLPPAESIPFVYSSSSRIATSRETITEVKRSTEEFEFQLEPPDPPVSLASSSSSRVTGPYFESNKTLVHITARAGQTVLFDCAVVLLQGRTVSWLRRRKDNLQLLTVGNATYYSDSRVGLRFRYPNNWRLGIETVQKGDEGEYQCQLSTHPPKALIFHLKVIAPAVLILDENGHVVTERHYKVDSSLHLTCKASHIDKLLDNIIWLKGDRPLPVDSRIKVKLTKNQTSGEATGFLSVLSVRKGDSGNYTCRASSLASSTIAVHVLNGELPAAVQHENSANALSASFWMLFLLPLLISSATLHMATFFHCLSSYTFSS